MNDETNSIFGLTPPPRESDELFAASNLDYQLNACIQHWGDVDHAYKAGFRRAGLNLVHQICAQPSEQDYQVYPIFYLYRHHVELMVKRIFVLSADLLDEEISKTQHKKLKTHDLAKLWHMISPKLPKICRISGEVPLPPEDLDGITSYMAQLNSLDPGGESFRYARRADGTRTIDVEVKIINIRTFAFHMEKLANYLDGLESWIAGMIEGRGDY